MLLMLADDGGAAAGRDERVGGSEDGKRISDGGAGRGDGDGDGDEEGGSDEDEGRADGCSGAEPLPLVFLLWLCGCSVWKVCVCDCVGSALPMDAVTRALVCSAASLSRSVDVALSEGCLRCGG